MKDEERKSSEHRRTNHIWKGKTESEEIKRRVTSSGGKKGTESAKSERQTERTDKSEFVQVTRKHALSPIGVSGRSIFHVERKVII